MSSATKHGTGIEWTHVPGTIGATWNPVVGCSIVSPGCINCYAMPMAQRIQAMTPAGRTSHYAGTTKQVKGKPVWTGLVAIAPDRTLTEPLRKRKPHTFFVNSMGDLFHDDVPNDWIDRVFAVMALCPQHTFIVLTKRSARMQAFVARAEEDGTIDAIAVEASFITGSPCAAGSVESAGWPLPNVWLGVSAERQQEADARVPDLLATPAAVRFVSAEPLLGPIDFSFVGAAKGADGEYRYDAMTGRALPWAGVIGGVGVWSTNKATPCPSLDWIIAGGESGSAARPMHPDWVRSIRDQCAAAEVPFFFKQWGEWEVASDDNGRRNNYSGHKMPETGEKFTWLGADGRTANPSAHDVGAPAYAMAKVGKRRAGHTLDGREHIAWPSAANTFTPSEFPTATTEPA